MERGLIVLVATLMVFVATGVQGTSHLSFSNSTVNITRDGCGTKKLCVETPDDCDPAKSGTCLFASVVTADPVPPNGTLMSFQLSGSSPGYIALGLTTNVSVGNTLLFVCAQNTSDNGSFFFKTIDRNNSNNDLNPNERRVQEIRGNVSENVIQCEFDVPMLNASVSRAMTDTTYTIILGIGTYTSDGLGAFNVLFKSDPLDLSNPASNIPTTTPMATTTGSSSAVHPQVMLVLLSILSVSPMLRA